MTNSTPWHRPGSWLVNPAYWSEDAMEARKGMPKRIRFIDCTLSEGDDCVGHQLNWNTRRQGQPVWPSVSLKILPTRSCLK